MATFDCVVDTHPMAQEVKSVSQHVNGTTTAVVAMKAAVILAEEEAANNVCDNVNRGFFTLIQSGISQKIAKLQSEVDSWLMKLNQQRRQLDNIRARMGRDYHLLTRRYTKLFSSINHNLHERIVAIDQPTMNLVEKEFSRVNNRSFTLTAAVPLMQTESISSSQTILTSEVKSRGVRAIEAMTKFLGESNDQDRLIRRVLLPRTINADEKTIYVPVVISQSNFDSSGSKVVSVLSGSDIAPSGIDKIKSIQETLQWSEPQAADGDVAYSFNEMLQKSKLSDRVKKLAAEMFNKSEYEKL